MQIEYSHLVCEEQEPRKKKQKAKKDSVTPLLTSHLQQNALQSRMSQRKWHPGGVRWCLMKKTAAEAAASSAHRSTFSTWSCSSSTSSSPCKGYRKPTSTTTELARTFLRLENLTGADGRLAELGELPSSITLGRLVSGAERIDIFLRPV